ncbi:MAG TPA: helix-turn-helix domain-containing protein [Candidatus Nanoarchaeia archaeon]|nr:helix-turn-helix domain-containing protein [Candidatus Nanoarchaeia archaeon]
MSEELKENSIYTTAETREILKISPSTMKRLLKKGMIRANKIGKQYRILGREIIRLVSPAAEKEAIKSYLGLKQKVKAKIRKW